MLRYTIITVTYNAGHTIRRTLDSVAAQEYAGIEHIIVDACSDDDTMMHIHRYVEGAVAPSASSHQIRLIREPDNGLYDAMNKAILQAKGDYLVFLNAGDVFHDTQVLQDISDQLLRYNPARLPAVVYGETDLVDDEGRFLRHRRLQAPDVLTSRSFLHGMVVCHQSFYVRADFARAHLYNLRYRYSADYDWCIRIMKRAEHRGLALHNSHLIFTDYLAEGMTTRNRRRSLRERLHIMAHHYGWPAAIAMHLWFVPRAVFCK